MSRGSHVQPVLEGKSKKEEVPSLAPMSYARVLLTFHHIRDPMKKILIRVNAHELGLYGLCKVGQQGVLLVEGEGFNVDLYVRRIKVSP